MRWRRKFAWGFPFCLLWFFFLHHIPHKEKKERRKEIQRFQLDLPELSFSSFTCVTKHDINIHKNAWFEWIFYLLQQQQLMARFQGKWNLLSYPFPLDNMKRVIWIVCSMVMMFIQFEETLLIIIITHQIYTISICVMACCACIVETC